MMLRKMSTVENVIWDEEDTLRSVCRGATPPTLNLNTMLHKREKASPLTMQERRQSHVKGCPSTFDHGFPCPTLLQLYATWVLPKHTPQNSPPTFLKL
jgi:hypothetical protein